MVALEPLFRITLGDGVRLKVGESGRSTHGGDSARVERSGGGEIVNDGGGDTGGCVATGGAGRAGGAAGAITIGAAIGGCAFAARRDSSVARAAATSG